MKSRRIPALALALLMLLSLGLAGCSGAADNSPTSSPATSSENGSSPSSSPSVQEDQQVSLRFSTFHESTDRNGKLDQQFVDYVTEATNGTVDITIYWSSSLMDVSTAFTETLEGVSDITLASTGYMPEHFVVDNAINLFYHNSASYADNFDMMHEVYETVDAWSAEYEGVTVLNFTNAVGASMAILSVKPIRSLDDLKGMTLRCTETSVFELMAELGANPVRMPLSEAYDSLSKGIIDGIVNVPTTFWQQKMGDIADYMTELEFMAPMTVQSYISDSAMAKLSPDQQLAIIDSARQALEADTIAQLDSQLADSYAYFEEADVEIITLDEESLAGLDAAWEAICLNKVQELNEQGYDGQGIYDTVREIVGKYE